MPVALFFSNGYGKTISRTTLKVKVFRFNVRRKNYGSIEPRGVTPKLIICVPICQSHSRNTTTQVMNC